MISYLEICPEHAVLLAVHDSLMKKQPGLRVPLSPQPRVPRWCRSTCRQQTEYLAQHPHVAQQWHDHELQLEQQALAQQAFLRSMHPPRGMIHDYILNGAFSLSVFVCHLFLFLLYIRSLPQ